MEYALGKSDRLTSAIDAEYGVYFCPECRSPCGLRRPARSVDHFYHMYRNENCSLYRAGKSIKNWKEVHWAIDQLVKNTTYENWEKAIDFLIEINELWRIHGFPWCEKPLLAYLERHGTDSKHQIGAIYVALLTLDRPAIDEMIRDLLLSRTVDLGLYHKSISVAFLFQEKELSLDFIEMIISNKYVENPVMFSFEKAIQREKKKVLARRSQMPGHDRWLRWERIELDQFEIDEVRRRTLERFSKLTEATDSVNRKDVEVLSIVRSQIRLLEQIEGKMAMSSNSKYNGEVVW